MKDFWTSHVADIIDTRNSIQTKTGFSNAMAVMDQVMTSWDEKFLETDDAASDITDIGGRKWQLACGFTPKKYYSTTKRTWMRSERRRDSVIEAVNFGRGAGH